MPRYQTIPHKPYTIYHIPCTKPPNAVHINRVGEREGAACDGQSTAEKREEM